MKIPFSTSYIERGMGAAKDLIGNNIRNKRHVAVGNPQGRGIYADDAESLIYVHDSGNESASSSLISVTLQDKSQLIFGNPILIEQTASGAWVIDRGDPDAQIQFGSGITAIPDQTPVNLNQLEYGTLQPYNGLVFRVMGAMYGNDYVVSTLTGDFSTGTVQDTSATNIVVPTTNRRAIGVLIQVDPSTGVLSYKQSAEYIATLSLQSQFSAGVLPDPDSSAYRIGYISLAKGVTSGDYSHIWQVPEMYSRGGGLWTNPIVSTVAIEIGEQQHAIEQTISTLGELTVSGEYYVDNELIISGGELIISSGEVIIRHIVANEPSLISKSVTKTADYTITLFDGNIFADASGGDITITLPTALSSIGRSFRVTRINAGGGNVIIDGNANETINGDLTVTVSSQWTSSILVSSGTDWIIG